MADFNITMSDADVAEIIAAAAGPVRQGFGEETIEVAVKVGRVIGKRESLEALDDGLRTAAAAALDHVRTHDASRPGLIHNLERLDQWLQRYPFRGRPAAKAASE